MAGGGKEQWSSRMAFIFAAVGSAIGLGNIWRFPYMAGENGGGAFVIVYVICVLLIGVPILMAELTLGRRGGMSPVRSLEAVAKESKSSGNWKWIGTGASFAGGLMLLAYYSVIAGWVLAYIIKAGSGMLVYGCPRCTLCRWRDDELLAFGLHWLNGIHRGAWHQRWVGKSGNLSHAGFVRAASGAGGLCHGHRRI
jgi:hypothetical protein